MRYHVFPPIVAVLFLGTLAANAVTSPPAEPAFQAAQPQGEQQKAQVPFRWLEASGDTAGVRLATRSLERLTLGSEYGTASEAEKETVPLGSDGTRTTVKIYDRDVNGSRRLIETVVEEVRNLPGGRTDATRVVSRRDVDGRLKPIRKDSQETTPTGSNAYQTTMTTQLPGPSGSLVRAEQIVQKEQAKGESQIEIDRIHMLKGGSGNWETNDRRVSTTRKSNDQFSTDEAVYRYDTNGNFQIDRQVTSKEWRDSRGREQREVSTYRSDLSGRLNLDTRARISRESLPDGTTQTSQVLEQQNPASPSEGLRLVERITEYVRVAGSDRRERELYVQAPDPNGQNQTVYSQRIVEFK
jgi:hypothetical protein